MYKLFKKILLQFLLINLFLFAQNQHTIMTYNILNYPITDTTSRNPYFRTIFANIQPDILVVQEMISQQGVNAFLNKILLPNNPNYQPGTFIDGFDTDNAIFFKSNLFTFISNTPIRTALRDINEFKLVYNITGDTLIIYSVHLKASDSLQNELLRAAEVDSLRQRTNLLPMNTNFIVLGDFNIYRSSELAYQKLLDQNSSGYVLDPLTLTGTWNNAAYSVYHTQSTRTRQFGDGTAGGLDDRFDMILMSQAVMDSGGIQFIPGSYSAYGNDGNHYNDSINRPLNNAVGQLIADALHYASDHLPVIASFNFPTNSKLLSLKIFIEGRFNGASMIPDSVTVELRNPNIPYNVIEQKKVLVNSNGLVTLQLNQVINNSPYYVVIKHRNSLETWSANTVSFVNDVANYDFTTSESKAYGNNLKLVGSSWCLITGDVNQDGVIDIGDLVNVFTNSVLNISGYVNSDLNGDLTTNMSDVNIVYQNNISGYLIKKP
ncbi:Endonuclease/exonuclease/phosphatase-like protein [Ignavibacterium album JCM 16511]|uniref:Endonuclease/exonuclease/phosphatase-like protein n=1 Tax=Ignavibacterium album (strain DSM 19864 / JCM 16511 / NBRC 101810 / Mat9-16) TaxID=945713 RepID=I0AKN3_IGNAJ|nr:endonuclease/exonuclease/phosphatase family protein [Ignavibacterium album]AFH49540.1 Endonuclease/exonuclease/phosphatase-like protein [Ignavibacterium album JCM 16511]